MDLIDPPSFTVGDKFVNSTFYLVRFFYEIALLYGCHITPPEYVNLIDSSLSAKTARKKTTTVWLCQVLELSPDALNCC